MTRLFLITKEIFIKKKIDKKKTEENNDLEIGQ